MKTYICDFCGKKVQQDEGSLPEGWREIKEYDTNKYTDEHDAAIVCSQECEVRLAKDFGSGGLR